MARLFLVTAALLGFASGLVTPAHAAQQNSAPDEMALLMERAGVFLNRHNYPKLETVFTPEAAKSLEWARHLSAEWKAEVLTVPGADAAKPAAYLGVFHTWHTCEADGDHVYPIVKQPDGYRLGAEILELDPGPFRLKEHRLTVHADIAVRKVTILDDAKFVPVNGKAGIPATFRIGEDYKVTSLKLGDGSGKAVPFKQVGGVVGYLPPAEDGFTLSMEYSGKPDHKDGDFIRTDEVCLCSYWYPHTARLPVKYAVTADVPAGWRLVPQGEPDSVEPLKDGLSRSSYHSDLAVSYLTLDMGRYFVTSADMGGHKLSAYLLDNDPELAKQCIQVIAKSLEFYEKNFGKFPFTRYAVVQSRWVSDMALEAYAFATYGPRGLPELIPHELSHSWWGGRVVCPYTTSMWNEAFAEYSDALFRRSLDPNSDGGQGTPPFRRVNDAFSQLPVAHAFDTNDRVQSAVGYDKGSLVMRVLEEEIGQETLLRSMRAFLEEHPAGEAADWPEFEMVVNRVSGQDMGWFFHQWLEQTGLPSLVLGNLHSVQKAEGSMLSFDVVQPTHPYRLSLELAVKTSDGIQYKTVKIGAERLTHIDLPVNVKAVSVRVNPRGILPLQIPSERATVQDPSVYNIQ